MLVSWISCCIFLLVFLISLFSVIGDVRPMLQFALKCLECAEESLKPEDFKGPSRVIVDMRTYALAKSRFMDPIRLLLNSIDELPPNFRIILVSLCVSFLPGTQFDLSSACNIAKTYCAGLKLDLVNQSQVQQALEYFLQNGLVETSEKSTMRKLGKGSRSNDFEKVCSRWLFIVSNFNPNSYVVGNLRVEGFLRTAPAK